MSRIWVIGMLLPLAVVALIVFLIVRATRGGGAFRAFATRRPRKRRLVTRIVCGSLGGLILLAVTVGTFREVGSVYATDDEAAGLKLRVPTKELKLPEKPAGRHSDELEDARLLFAIVIAERRGGEWIPVRADEHELRFPEDRGVSLAGRMDVHGRTVSYDFRVDKVLATEDRTALDLLGGHMRFSVDRWSSRSGGMRYEPVAHIHDVGGGWQHAKSPLSIALGPTPELHAFHVATFVSADDPLTSVPAAELIRSRRAEFRRATRQLDAGYGPRIFSDEDIPLRGFAAATHFGVASLLLLVAAILFSQLFARKGLAFAGTLAGVVLFTAVLDRAALGSHLSRVEDKEALLAARMTGCVHAADTFFYRGTAGSRLRSVLEDDATPGALRDLAGEIEIELDKSPIGRSVGYFVGYPARQYRDVRNLTEFDLDELAPELERRFPVRLSSKALGEGDSGLWIACRKVHVGDLSVPRLQLVAFVSWRDGRVTRAVQVPELVAAFAHGGHVYYHWWEELTGDWGMYLACDADGWTQISDFSFARVRRGDVDESKLRLRPLEEYGKLIDRSGDELHDGVALYDIEVLTGDRDGRLQSVVDFR
ncbi:MAG: hypothetical protein ACYS9X_07810 [Planctomycetota bacterium]|jgi:hypothetical protein